MFMLYQNTLGVFYDRICEIFASQHLVESECKVRKKRVKMAGRAQSNPIQSKDGQSTSTKQQKDENHQCVSAVFVKTMSCKELECVLI